MFSPGSVEEDHVRRHSNYVADTAGEWATALLVLMRGVLASFGLIALATLVAGLLVNLVYRMTPIVCLDELRPSFAPAPEAGRRHVPRARRSSSHAGPARAVGSSCSGSAHLLAGSSCCSWPGLPTRSQVRAGNRIARVEWCVASRQTAL